MTLAQASEWREVLRREGAVVVWTNGCFDLLHPGHIQFLTEARSLGDALIVGVNGDESVRGLKGQGRPFIPVRGRSDMLVALRCVDAVVVLQDTVPIPELQVLTPDIFCKDSNYTLDALHERSTVEGFGGRIVLLPRRPWSTTALSSMIADRPLPNGSPW
jgi:rfaE bifunctional protein nucleotidyltransferase chain/domain